MIEALCHDNRSLAAGTLEEATDQECRLVVSSNATAPAFARGASAVLNLFEPSSGRSENIKVRIVRAARDQGRWVYRLRWERKPGLLARHFPDGRKTDMNRECRPTDPPTESPST
jgi:hypothetical protein